MLRVQPITSLDEPILEPYRTMRRQRDHQQQQIFVAEGEKVVRRLLESHLTVLSLLLPVEWLRRLEPVLKSRREDIHAFVAPKPLLETLTGFSMYQGVLAVGKIPACSTLESVCQTSTRPYLLAAIEGLSNAENVGALVRNCVAFGAHALIVDPTSSSPFLRRAVRSSMGAIFNLPVVEAANLAETLSGLRARGIRCLAAHPRVEGRTVARTDLTTDCCIVFGSEGYGLAPAVLAACDEAVAVPMNGGVDSLNVGSASAVFLYEANRQRRKM